jgi:hypothetical protein
MKCPVNANKIAVRKRLGKYCKNANKVFTLLGTDGGILNYCGENTVVYSAETNYSVFTHQVRTLKNSRVIPCYGQASHILAMCNHRFDFIWLDFFGSAMDQSNLAAVIQATKKLNGTIAITSKLARQKSNIDHYHMFNILKLNIFDHYKYRNNGNSMNLFIGNKK